MKLFKDLTLGLMFLSISVFFVVISFGASSLVERAENVFLQQEKIFGYANKSSEIISEVSLMGAALALEEFDFLGRIDAQKIVEDSIENIGDRSERLEVILNALNDNRTFP